MQGGSFDVWLAKAAAAASVETSSNARVERNGTVVGKVTPVRTKSPQAGEAPCVKEWGNESGNRGEWDTIRKRKTMGRFW
jgi:hypothetical protein